MNKKVRQIIFNIVTLGFGALCCLGFTNPWLIIPAILGLLVTLIALIAGNILLSGKVKPTAEKEKSPEQEVEEKLRGKGYSVSFNDLQSQALKQLERAKNSRKNAIEAVDKRFQDGSITADRYKEIISAAYEAELDNLRIIGDQFSLLNNTDYRAFRNKSTAANISEEQLATIQKITATIDSTFKRNEELIFKVDNMAANLYEMTQDDGKTTESVTQEVEELTEQLKFYARGI